MVEVTITFTHDGSNSYVTVSLMVVRSAEPMMKSRLEEAFSRLKMPDGSVIATTAVEAACFSGAFFASRRASEAGYAVTINHAFGELPSGDLTICAVATSNGVLYAVNQQGNTTKEVFEDWRLTELSKRGHL